MKNRTSTLIEAPRGIAVPKMIAQQTGGISYSRTQSSSILAVAGAPIITRIVRPEFNAKGVETMPWYFAEVLGVLANNGKVLLDGAAFAQFAGLYVEIDDIASATISPATLAGDTGWMILQGCPHSRETILVNSRLGLMGDAPQMAKLVSLKKNQIEDCPAPLPALKAISGYKGVTRILK